MQDDPSAPDFLPSRIRDAKKKPENFRWALEHHGHILTERQREIIRALMGLDGPAVGPYTLAERYGTYAKPVYKSFQGACKRLTRSIAADALRAQLPDQPPQEDYHGLERTPYPSDLTDADWEKVAPLVPPRRFGRKARHTRREVINALLYRLYMGCEWAELPHDLPPQTTVWWYYKRWREDGTLQALSEALGVNLLELAPVKRRPRGQTQR